MPSADVAPGSGTTSGLDAAPTGAALVTKTTAASTMSRLNRFPRSVRTIPASFERGAPTPACSDDGLPLTDDRKPEFLGGRHRSTIPVLGKCGVGRMTVAFEAGAKFHGFTGASLVVLVTAFVA